MDGADGGTIGHHAEIAGQVLDRVAGEQGDAVVAADAARGQKRGDLPGQPPQLPVADRASIVDRNNIGLVRIALGRAIDPASKQVWPKLSFFQPCNLVWAKRPPGARKGARRMMERQRPVRAKECTQPTMRDLAFSMSFLVKKSSGLTRSTG